MLAAGKADADGQPLSLGLWGELMKALTLSLLWLEGRRTCVSDQWQIRAPEPAGRERGGAGRGTGRGAGRATTPCKRHLRLSPPSALTAAPIDVRLLGTRL